jgi:hypothetical protein
MNATRLSLESGSREAELGYEGFSSRTKTRIVLPYFV